MGTADIRVGTWNLDGRWSRAHQAFLAAADCDVWLLTEVDARTHLAVYTLTASTGLTPPGHHWAAVLSRHQLTKQSSPHPASASALIGGTVFCSSVLPWRTCGSAPPWTAGNVAAKTRATLEALEAALAGSRHTVWGGDWNHSLSGREYAGSAAGRELILATLGRLGLSARTGDLPHQLPGVSTIDHIAGPPNWTTVTREHLAVGALSDHDVYVCELGVPREAAGPAVASDAGRARS